MPHNDSENNESVVSSEPPIQTIASKAVAEADPLRITRELISKPLGKAAASIEQSFRDLRELSAKAESVRKLFGRWPGKP